jgi:hypothetical protein
VTGWRRLVAAVVSVVGVGLAAAGFLLFVWPAILWVVVNW